MDPQLFGFSSRAPQAPLSSTLVRPTTMPGHRSGKYCAIVRLRSSLKLYSVLADRLNEALTTSKMAIAITNPTHTAPEAAAQAPAAAKSAKSGQTAAPAQSASKAGAPTDTATISTAAQAASQEAKETPAQTAKEASHGDQQAARLLAKEAAAKKA